MFGEYVAASADVAKKQEKHIVQKYRNGITQCRYGHQSDVRRSNVQGFSPYMKSPVLSCDSQSVRTISATAACIQREEGDLSCEAIVSFRDKAYIATGYNQPSSAEDSLSTFRRFSLNRLADLGKKLKEEDFVSNQMGACAEPHAVAKALKKREESQKKKLTTAKKNRRYQADSANNNLDKVDKIEHIYVGPAYITQTCKNRIAEHVAKMRVLEPSDLSIGKSILGREPLPKNARDAKLIKNSSPSCSHPRCRTCQQWIPGNDVLDKYLEQN